MKTKIILLAGIVALLLFAACERGAKSKPEAETAQAASTEAVAEPAESPPAGTAAEAPTPGEEGWKIDYLDYAQIFDNRDEAVGKVCRDRLRYYRRISKNSLIALSVGRSFDRVFLYDASDKTAAKLDEIHLHKVYSFTFRVLGFTNTGRVRGQLLDVAVTPEGAPEDAATPEEAAPEKATPEKGASEEVTPKEGTPKE